MRTTPHRANIRYRAKGSREAQAEGELAADLEPRALALTLLSIHQGLGVLLVNQPPDAERLDTEGVLRVMTRMLQAFAPEREG